MKQRVFYGTFSAVDIIQCRLDSIDRIVLRGQAIHEFHSGLGAIWDKKGREILPADCEEIQGTIVGVKVRANELGETFQYQWDYIAREPIAYADDRRTIFEDATMVVEACRGECFVTNRWSGKRARLFGELDGFFTLYMVDKTNVI